MLSLVVCLAVAAEPDTAEDTSWSQPSRSEESRTPWVVLGGTVWAPIGALSGIAGSFATQRPDGLDNRLGVGVALGLLAGITLGALLGWAAEAGWKFGKLGVLIPLGIEVAAVVVAGCVGAAWLQSR